MPTSIDLILEYLNNTLPLKNLSGTLQGKQLERFLNLADRWKSFKF